MEKPGALSQRCVPWILVLLMPSVIAAGSLRYAARAPAPGAAEERAYFLVGFPTETTSFVLLLSDPARIAEAREIIEQAQDDRHIFGGRIVKESAAWNPPWSYYVDPGSVVFAQAFIEVCDADPRYVEEHLDEVGGAFLPGNYWCPWSSRLLREVQVFQPQGRVYLPLILRGVDYVSAIATHRVSAADRSAAAMTPWM